ncbi:type IV pili methyl-accepting chemotaxis transducer N-terminal domain-containing protein [Pontibacterium granulatum]|uniref:type IV pili methyl-accepting chemotaxis transducer N-terminal domain-containing protein n=1 Tax=Pontibacterium granulatum TaxID=2036029 RepID=UPI00249B49B1|nr:type IV pili methyl-accepting chemotaxis transducer N-terminal domain-containing protein [Pontibacterium granulatum]MDI3325326.1 type IV pili methyl-accepting chemotaxis transducer N-terminal domain-containing protein [Pontibacterium granulatum]
MMNNKNILTMIGTLFTLLSLGLAGSARAEIASPEEALLKASEARMYTQRMLKNYALVGQDIRARKADAELQETISAFENHMSELRNFANDDTTRASLSAVTTLWEKAKPELTKAPSKTSVENVREQFDALLQGSTQVINSIIAANQPANSKLIQLSGRQAMLSQRIAGTYALMAWGYQDKYRSSYEKSYADFQKTMDLMEGIVPVNIDADKSAAALKKIKRQFKRVQLAKGDTFVPGLVNRSSEKLLDTINNASNIFTGLN